MKDKNSVIGVVLLAILFFVFFWYTNKQQSAYIANQKRIQDSLRLDSLTKVTPEQKSAARFDSLHRDSLSKLSAAGNFSNTANIEEQLVTIENHLVKITFTSKGGRVKSVELKQYLSQTGGRVILGGTDKDLIAYSINTANNRSASTAELNFTPSKPVKNADGSQMIRFTLMDSTHTGIVHEYLIKPDSYLIDWNISLDNAGSLLTGNTMNFHFVSQPMQVEKSVDYERRMSDVGFSEDNDFDYISSKTQHTFERPVQWVASVQQFFNSTLIAKNSFNSGDVRWQRREEDTFLIRYICRLLLIRVPEKNKK